jgi:hypothetical protein
MKIDTDPDPLVRGMFPWIRIRIRIYTKMLWIRNTAHDTILLTLPSSSCCRMSSPGRQRLRPQGHSSNPSYILGALD